MHRRSSQLVFSPADLTNYVGSPYVTWMDRLHIESPGQYEPDAPSATDVILRDRGIAHERQFLESLRAAGRDVVNVAGEDDRIAATASAMRAGRDVIYQGALFAEPIEGYADFLIKTPGASDLGDYHYEPWDTKLALHTKPYFLIQLACYADLLRHMQGVLPQNVHVVLGNAGAPPKHFRTEDYIYYYRQVVKGLLDQQATWCANTPPDFTGLEDFGRWTSYAEQRMTESDHLCRVANMRAVQIKKLQASGITTMTGLAETSLPTIPKMQPATFATLKQQARLQVASADLDRPRFEVIAPQPAGLGLNALPTASPMDVYFDMEGYPLIKGGLEYLFGATVIENGEAQFYDWWAHDKSQERRAFEEFVDWAYRRWQTDPTMHIYHYAAYEKTALRQLMGGYGTRESEIDDLLRAGVFVDLYSLVRQAIRVGVPNYSIKSIEHLYKEHRQGEVATALESVVAYQNWLDHPDGADWRTSQILAGIRAYNKEDCESTYMLVRFLRALQQEEGINWTAPPASAPSQSQAAAARSAAAQLAADMLSQLPSDPAAHTEESRRKELLAHLLEFHWREAKPVFWAKYERASMTEPELFDDPGCLAGLRRTATPPQAVKQSFHYEYAFDPAQDTKIDRGSKCFFAHNIRESITVATLDSENGIANLTRGKNAPAPPPSLSLIKDEYIKADTISDSIYRTALALTNGQPLPQALEDFLSRRAPRVAGWTGGPLIPAGADRTQGAIDVIGSLEESTLCIQGPPGSGKTQLAAKAITELLRRGETVGISSNSHAAIANLIDRVAAETAASAVQLRGVKIQSDAEDFYVQSSLVQRQTTEQLFKGGVHRFNLIGGTAWLFSNPLAIDIVDYLFVDEAGQVAIANLAGMAPSTRNIVLMGDQMQLAQPLQGTHPGESGQSTLQYLLQDRQVVPDDFGIFLGTSFRMHPDVCRFISGAVYEDRLDAHPDTARRVIRLPETGVYRVKPSGVIFVPVAHEGNSQESEEEVAAIEELLGELLRCTIFDGDCERPLTVSDVIVVAPYNMQVRRLKERLQGVRRIGSVDKFQGQEAPVVIVSMCSSSGDASARGLEFIFSKNRLNVAISRAQTLAVVVGSPTLAQSRCTRVEKIELVNLFCRAMEGF